MHLSHIHVRDVAQAIIRLLRDPPTGIENLESMLPESFRWTDLPTMVERLLQKTDSLGLNASAATEYAYAEATHDNREVWVTRIAVHR